MNQPSFNPEEIYQTDLPIGEILRRARLHYGQSLSDVENNIRIRASQIEAIEKGDFEKMPGRVYAIGFVRSYSEYLGLDGEKMVKLFKVQYSGGRVMKTELNFPVASEDVRVAPNWMIIGCVAGVLLIIGLWWIFQDNDRTAVETVPPVPTPIEEPEVQPVQQEVFGPPAPVQDTGEEDPAAPSEISPAETAPAQPATAPAADAKKSTILNIVENSWVEIKDKDGKTVVSRVLQAGDRYFVPDDAGLFMSLGNSGGVEIILDGEKLRPLGEVGKVQRNIPLDAASLKKNYGAKPKTP